MHRLMMEKIISSIIQKDANQFEDEEVLVVNIWNPHYEFPQRTPKVITHIKEMADAFAKLTNSEFRKVTSEIQEDKAKDTETLVLEDLYGVWNNVLCANKLRTNIKEGHRDIDNLYTAKNPKTIVDSMSFLYGGESGEITNLDFFYVIVVRWDKNRVEESVVTGYNVNQFIQDSLAGLTD